MSEGYYLHLQPSETAVFGAAANIFASYVATNQVTKDNEAEMMKKAIRAAISIARYVDKDMDQWIELKRKIRNEEVSLRQLERDTGIHRQTLRKIRDNSPPLGYQRTKPKPCKSKPEALIYTFVA